MASGISCVAALLTLDKTNTRTSITTARSRLNYPEMVFAGAADSTTLNNLYSQWQSAQSANTTMPISVPDPDVKTLEVIGEAQSPKHDTGNPAFLRDMNEPHLRPEILMGASGSFTVSAFLLWVRLWA